MLTLRRCVPTVAIAAVLATACSGGGGRRAAPTTAPTNATTTTSTTSVPTQPLPVSWARLADPTLAVGGGPTATVSAVMAPALGSTTWAIAGTRLTARGTSSPTVWTSADGRAWRATAIAVRGGAGSASAMTTWRTATFVVGSVGVGEAQRAAVWTSASPAGPYTAVPVTPLVARSAAAMTVVTGGALGVFAIGADDGRPAVWSSTNGQAWTESDSFAKVMTQSVDARVTSLLATNNAVYAAGSAADGADTVAALWSTTDGLNWHRIRSADVAFGGPGRRVINALAPLGTGLVAVGSIGVGPASSPASWISPDGASWSQPSEDFAMGTRAQQTGNAAAALDLAAVPAPSGNLLFAVGGGSGAGRLWRSADGVRWAEVAQPADAVASVEWHPALVGSNGVTTVVADSDPGRPYVLAGAPGGWSEPSADPAVFGPVQTSAVPTALTERGATLTMTVSVDSPPQRIGDSAKATVVLVSTGGSRWRRAGPSGAGPVLPAGATTAVHWAGRWVAIGISTAHLAKTAGPDTMGLAAAWTSTDGVQWRAAGPLDRRPGVEPQQVGGLCARGNRVVAVGSSGGAEARAWVSSDGARWAAGAVDPPAIAGGAQAFAGCTTTASGFVAFGFTTAPGGDLEPALWSSPTGNRWTRLAGAGLGAADPPIGALARSGLTWVAIAGTDQLVLSPDGGNTWQLLPTGVSPWTGSGLLQLAVAAFDGRSVVVAGALGGRVAVWIGTVAATAATATTATSAPPA